MSFCGEACAASDGYTAVANGYTSIADGYTAVADGYTAVAHVYTAVAPGSNLVDNSSLAEDLVGSYIFLCPFFFFSLNPLAISVHM